METTPYIGALISLVSKAEIRYEGILFTIDTKESNIALQNVRSFGTEDRKLGGTQIPPSNEVYDCIIFRGSDIKDLHVMTQPQAAPHADPAIVNAPVLGHQQQYQGQQFFQPPHYGAAQGGYPPRPPPGLWGQPPPYGAPSPYGPPQSQWGAPAGYYMNMPPQQQQQQAMPQTQTPQQQQYAPEPVALVTPSAPQRQPVPEQKLAPTAPSAPTPRAAAVPSVPVPLPPPLAPAPTMPKAAPAPVARPRPSSYAGAAGAVSNPVPDSAPGPGRAAPNGPAAARPRAPGAPPSGAPAGGRGYGRPAPVAAIVVPAEDFDFASNLQKFSKPGPAPAPVSYNKDDFFDNISLDSKDDGRRRYNTEQRTNSETFGTVSASLAPPSLPQFRSGPGGRDGGRGAGGRGAGRSDAGRGGAGRTGGRGSGRDEGRSDGQKRSLPAPRAAAGRA